MGKKVNLIGQRYNHLFVIKDLGDGYWNCRCDCGQIKKIRGYELTHDKIKSCGRCGARSNFIDLTNKQFGDWTVIKYIGDRKWECRCSCGKIGIVSGGDLRTGHSKSCGHSTNGFKDLKGKIFGSWEVIEYVGDKKWKCRCKCGRIQDNDTQALLRGLTTKCKVCAGRERGEDLTNQVIGEWTVLRRSKLGGSYWECRCSCGTVKDVEGYSLKTGKSTSCGHDCFIDLTGKHFGEWEVVKYQGDKKWLCKCSCGTQRILSGGNLRNGSTSSCGCKQASLRKATLLSRYGDTATSRLFSPRDPNSQDIFDNAEKLKQFLIEFKELTGEKPTSHDLALELGVSYHSINRKLLQLGLKGYIQVGFNHKSSYEKEIESLLESLGIEYISNSRTIVSGVELDIYIPSKRIAIEMNGDYWHSAGFKDYKFHQNKTIACAKLGIRLIHIFEYEWLNTDIKNKLISFITGLVTPKNKKDTIYARNLIVRHTDTIECTNFLNSFHIQGSAQSSIRLGLYDSTDLIGIMTFGKPRFDNSFEWELIRLAYKSNKIVIGGTEKLFRHFLNEYNPYSIVCYTNIAKFTGNVYTKLGFKTSIDCITKPNYIWTIPGSTEVYTRYQTMTKRLLEYGLGIYGDTEDEIMTNLGYVKIYDSGNLKFEWRKATDA